MKASELRKALEARGMNQADFARMLGIGRSAVSRWCSDDADYQRKIPPYMPLLLEAIDRRKAA